LLPPANPGPYPKWSVNYCAFTILKDHPGLGNTGTDPRAWLPMGPGNLWGLHSTGNTWNLPQKLAIHKLQHLRPARDFIKHSNIAGSL
jgi:hypothetical protein